MNRPRCLALLLTAALLASCNMERPEGDGEEKSDRKKDRKVLVRITHPERGKLNDSLEITGRIEAYEEADVVPRIDGTVVQVHHFEGEEVKKGTILAEIDCREQVILRDIRKIEVQQSARAVERAHLAQREAQSRADTQAATLARDQRALERAKGQHAAGALSDEALDTAQYTYDQALAMQTQLDIARDNLEQELKVQELMGKAAEGQLRQAELACEWSKVRATIDGRITKRMLKLGQKTVPGQAAFAIADFDSLVIEPSLAEKELRLLRPGLAVTLGATAYPGTSFTGEVDFIAPEVENGGVRVRIRLPRSDPPLLPGMFVAGKIITEERTNILLVPKKALLFDRERAYVYVLDRDEAESAAARKVYLRRGLEDEERVEYLPLEGKEPELDEKSEVVVVGLDRLFDGASVEIADAETGKVPAETNGGEATDN